MGSSATAILGFGACPQGMVGEQTGAQVDDNRWTVVERLVDRDTLALRLKDAAKPIRVRRFTPVGRGDTLVRCDGHLFVELRQSRERVRLTPAWRTAEVLPAGPNLRFVVKEIETQEELEGFKRLTEYHYRGNGGAGRRVPLIAVVDNWELPRVVGFIELASSFLVNTARTRLLDDRFSDSARGVAWTRWNTNGKRHASKGGVAPSNSVVRISRCVVFPELRGVGLSKILVDAAVEFARERWHIGGVQPSFVEITAEMLRYWPFVKGSSFLYVGDTDGNAHRVGKDMRYLLGRALQDRGLPQGGGGILSTQRSHATLLKDILRRRELTLPEILDYLRKSPDKLSDDEWVLLHRVFRREKPTYMRGLTVDAERFLERRHSLGGKASGRTPAKPDEDRLVLELEDLRLEVQSRPTSSTRARRVQEAFGIVSTEFKARLVEGLNLRLNGGEVLLIGGPSGTGKSLLLRAIRKLASGDARGRRLPTGVRIEVRRTGPRVAVSWPKEIRTTQTPIELLRHLELEEALRVLALAGLAEAQLFVRSASTLSRGQSYRLGLALALAEKPDLLLVDEFCEPLDRFSAFAVCRRLRLASERLGIAVVVATADPERVSESLQPDKTLLLSSGGTHCWRR